MKSIILLAALILFHPHLCRAEDGGAHLYLRLADGQAASYLYDEIVSEGDFRDPVNLPASTFTAIRSRAQKAFAAQRGYSESVYGPGNAMLMGSVKVVQAWMEVRGQRVELGCFGRSTESL
jgi:hypothetical protein